MRLSQERLQEMKYIIRENIKNAVLLPIKFSLARHPEEASQIVQPLHQFPLTYTVTSALQARFTSSYLPKCVKEINSSFKIAYQLISGLSDYFLKDVAGQSSHSYTVTSLLKNPIRNFSGSPVVKTELPTQGAQVQSLLEELRSHMLHSVAKKV